MTRNRNSAKKAGASFERLVADYLKNVLSNPNIDRRVRTGSKDCGDIANVRTKDGFSMIIECKDYGGEFHVSEWLREAEVERINDDAILGFVVAKRRGISEPSEQVVFMNLKSLAKILARI
jgi:hypothetical protein